MDPNQILNIIDLVSKVLASNGVKIDLVVHTEAGKEGVQVKVALDINVPLAKDKQDLQIDGKV